MHSMPTTLASVRRVALSSAFVMALGSATRVSAAVPACPLAADAVVAQAVGASVHGGIMTDFVSDTPLDTGPDKTVCWWDTDLDTSVTLSRQSNAFGPGGAANPTAGQRARR